MDGPNRNENNFLGTRHKVFIKERLNGKKCDILGDQNIIQPIQIMQQNDCNTLNLMAITSSIK